jgi:hypothetical protein
MLIIPHLKTQYLPKLGNNSKRKGANKLVLLYVQDYVTVVPHLTEVRFMAGRSRLIVRPASGCVSLFFWIVNYQIGDWLISL